MNRTTRTLNFHVPGIPATAGSKRAIPLFDKKKGTYRTRPNGAPMVVLVGDNKRGDTWRESVRAECRRVYYGDVFRGSVRLHVVFVFSRPNNHFRTGKNAHMLRESAPKEHTQKPDCTKLIRAVEDALNGVVWHDDSQITRTDVEKLWGAPGQAPGAYVTIELVGAVEPPREPTPKEIDDMEPEVL